MIRSRLTLQSLTLATLVSTWLGSAPNADAGCGCDKPPPPAAPVRPAFASPGGDVSLFSAALKVGDPYRVKFIGNRREGTVSGYAVERRDLADGVSKIQLVVPAPDLPPGPTRIKVKDSKDATVLDIDASEFTMLQNPLALTESNGETRANCYQAAVGKDGTVYLPLDVAAISKRVVFSGVGYGYPLLFGPEDVVIYNTQGFLMQLLGPAQEGIYSITDPGSPDSFELTYDRHEFITYEQEHATKQEFLTDAADPAWHVDGTRHIDHDHLVLALHGVVEGRGNPEPGKTPAFDLSIVTFVPDSPTSAAKTQVLTWSSTCSNGKGVSGG